MRPRLRIALAVIIGVAIITVPGYAVLDNATDTANSAADQAQDTADENGLLIIELAAQADRLDRQQAQLDQAVQDLADQQAAFELERCASRRDFAIVLRAVVERSDDGEIVFSTIEGFDDLDAPTRQFLLNIETAAASAPDPSQFVLDALQLIGPIPVCGDEPPPDEPG